ncbi:hypothetical protein D9M71_140920 [compost metagenome]
MPVGKQAVHAGSRGLHFAKLHEGRAVLGHQHAAIVQAAAAGLVEVLGEQHLARTDGIGGVGDDHVELLLGGGDEAHAVVDHQVQARVFISALGVVRQEFLAHFDDSAVDLDHGDALDIAVLAHFTQHAAVATADDQHALHRAVGEDRYVGEHLVIDELVRLGGLNHAIQRHHTAHARIFEDHQMLVLGAHFVQQLVHAEALAVSVVESFLVIAHGLSPLLAVFADGTPPQEKARILRWLR